ncbi:MAG TPA: hypothetical protein VGC76_04265 [Pyrinomonadaceae bacterium]|jgi:hypothetical protein
MQPREHARLLGLFFFIYAGLQFFIIAFIGLIYVGVLGGVMASISNMPRRANEPNPEAIFGLVIFIVVIALAFGTLFLIPKIIAGIGLRKEKSWAKVWAIVACCLAVLNIPIGTALAVYGFWFIFGDMGKAYFDNYQLPYNSPPPPPHNWQ